MKTPTRTTLAALALAAIASSSYAQGQDAWVSVSPEGEIFTVRMPGEPASSQQQLSGGELKAEGRRYEAAGGDGAAYIVLSLRDTDGAAERLVTISYQGERFRRESFYLDEITKLAQEALARPGVETAGGGTSARFSPSLSYRREFELSGRPAREYFVTLGEARGPVYVCADGPHIYVVAALAPEPQPASLKQFVDSFELKTETAAPSAAQETKADPAAATGIGPGRGGSAGAGGEHAFTTAEVTEKARITAKPEPLYTEDARRFRVAGKVRVRIVLAPSGEVERVEVEKGLPHGLTLSAVEAARKISFEPARKDGRPVAQYANIEYNFNIY